RTVSLSSRRSCRRIPSQDAQPLVSGQTFVDVSDGGKKLRIDGRIPSVGAAGIPPDSLQLGQRQGFAIYVAVQELQIRRACELHNDVTHLACEFTLTHDRDSQLGIEPSLVCVSDCEDVDMIECGDESLRDLIEADGFIGKRCVWTSIIPLACG